MAIVTSRSDLGIDAVLQKALDRLQRAPEEGSEVETSGSRRRYAYRHANGRSGEVLVTEGAALLVEATSGAQRARLDHHLARALEDPATRKKLLDEPGPFPGEGLADRLGGLFDH